MRTLLRVALALLIAIPVCLGMVIFFAMAARQGREQSAAALERDDDAPAGRSRLGLHRAAA